MTTEANTQADLAFEDGKSPTALRTIGEVTRALGIRQHVLRYWEEQFPMLSPLKRSGGRRYYRPEDIALIARIDRLVHHEGFTLRGARQVIEAGQAIQAAKGEVVPHLVPAVAIPPAPVHSTSIIDELRAIRSELAAALAQT